MEDRCFQLVQMMHKKFGLDAKQTGRLTPEERAFRIACMQEELEEFKTSGSLVDDYDAMLDLIVFAMGTLDRMGLPFAEAFEIVMSCNMSKTLGPNAKRGNFKRDLVKPDDFVGPEVGLQRIIDEAGGHG